MVSLKNDRIVQVLATIALQNQSGLDPLTAPMERCVPSSRNNVLLNRQIQTSLKCPKMRDKAQRTHQRASSSLVRPLVPSCLGSSLYFLFVSLIFTLSPCLFNFSQKFLLDQVPAITQSTTQNEIKTVPLLKSFQIPKLPKDILSASKKQSDKNPWHRYFIY